MVVNASVVAVQWEGGVDTMSLNALSYLPPTVMERSSRCSDSWLQSMIDSSVSSSWATALDGISNNISACPSAVSTLLNHTHVYARMYHRDTWQAMISLFAAQRSADPNEPDVTAAEVCSIPFIASAPLRFAAAESRSLISMAMAAADYVTVAIVQCTEVPLTFQYEVALQNDGTEVSSDRLPFLRLFVFQTCVYGAGACLWTRNILSLVQRDATGLRFGRIGRVEYCLWIAFVARFGANVLLVLQSSIQREDVSNLETTSATRMGIGASVATIVSSICALALAMLAGCGVSFLGQHHALQSKQKSTIYLLLAAYGSLTIAAASKYRERYAFLVIAPPVVFVVGVLYGIVELRTVCERLRIEVRVSQQAADTIAWLRLTSFSIAFRLLVVVIIAGWLLQALLLTDTSYTYLSDAVGEFSTAYWLFVANFFLRRDNVVVF